MNRKELETYLQQLKLTSKQLSECIQELTALLEERWIKENDHLVEEAHHDHRIEVNLLTKMKTDTIMVMSKICSQMTVEVKSVSKPPFDYNRNAYHWLVQVVCVEHGVSCLLSLMSLLTIILPHLLPDQVGNSCLQ